MNNSLYILKARLVTVALFVFVALAAHGQKPLKADVKDVSTALAQLGKHGDNIKVKAGKLPRGGHLQGLALYTDNKGRGYMFITGSSSSKAYYITFGLSDSTMGYFQERYVKELDSVPYKHAGGCQVCGKYLVVGVEDNDDKNSSKVMIYDISVPGNSDSLPVSITERRGKYKDATAGAVAAIETDVGLLVAVAGWDADPIDIYLANGKKPGEHGFKLDSMASFNDDGTNNWHGVVLKERLAYQSINFVSDTGGIHLIGFARDGRKNVADVFKLVQDSDNRLSLNKEGSYHFKCHNGTSFRFGAGTLIRGGHLYLYATSRRKHFGALRLNLFRSPPGIGN